METPNSWTQQDAGSKLSNIKDKNRVSEVQSELSSVDFSCYMKVLNVQLNIALRQAMD